ncbi:MAG: anti-sigma factor [Ardenticatenia bacterium]|nr:anti-sigma factor [Ardenticatenia bacterium]
MLYYLDNDRTGVLVVNGLAPLAQDQAYQLWLIRPDGRRDNGGVFRVERPGELTLHRVVSPAPWTLYTGVGVTVEPATGSPGPTGPRVLHGGL